MNYTEEIEKKKAEIRELEIQQFEEMKQSFPNIIGKIYRPSATSLWKVKEIIEIFSASSCVAEVIKIILIESYVVITTAYDVEINDIYDIEEVSQEMFDKLIEESIEVLKSQCK